MKRSTQNRKPASRTLGHRIYPYLLRDMDIKRPGLVWASDITFIPFKQGYIYLVTVMDWHSRKVLSWRISNTLDSEFCVSALMDNIFVERLWWTVKYDYLHLHSFENSLELRKGLRSWFEYYNRERTHQSRLRVFA